MANDEAKVTAEDDIDDPIDEPTADTNWEERAKLLEQKLKDKGIAHRERTKALKEQLLEFKKAPPPKADSSSKDKNEFDYGELAFLTAKGVSDEDTDFLFQETKSTGKPLKELLGYNYVKEELKNRAEARATKAATPSGGKRSGQAATSTVEHWIAQINAGKATVMDIPDFDLRKKVLDERKKVERNKSTFTDRPLG